MLYLKPTQQRAIDAANDPRVSTIVLIGAVGTGKTDVAAHASISIAYSFPRTYWPVFRQNISTAKRSVIPSYLNMLDLMNLEEGLDYRYNRQDFEIIFDHNGSKIGFVEADVTKDRQGRKIKGIKRDDQAHSVLGTHNRCPARTVSAKTVNASTVSRTNTTSATSDLDSGPHACYPTSVPGSRQAAFTRLIRGVVRFSRHFYA
jgi:hypothetical protein